MKSFHFLHIYLQLRSFNALFIDTDFHIKWQKFRIVSHPSLWNIGKLLTLLSVLIVTFSCGMTRSTSNLQSAASVVDSRISSGLLDSNPLKYRVNYVLDIIFVSACLPARLAYWYFKFKCGFFSNVSCLFK